ncbi:MAG TPA: hypothetical protein VJ912_00060 [Candidatus Nanoarchaeia archaeon]|nr:hypothetical protein [Candidatus Nanoarchaeia archaeon]
MELDKLFKENPGISDEISEILKGKKKGTLEEFGKEKVESLKKSIEEIKESIKEREKLSKEFIEECEKIKTEINNFLIENQGYATGDFERDRDSNREKNDLRSQKVDISKAQINERINAWNDIAILKKELREKEKELKEREARINEINKIMKGDKEDGSSK